MGGNLAKFAIFETNHFVCCSWHVRYLGCRYCEVSLYLRFRIKKNMKKAWKKATTHAEIKRKYVNRRRKYYLDHVFHILLLLKNLFASLSLFSSKILSRRAFLETMHPIGDLSAQKYYFSPLMI